MKHQVMAAVLKNKKIAPGIYRMKLESPEIAQEAKPGQFVTIECPAHLAFLRRPFSIAFVEKRRFIYLFYKVVGPGTEWLSQRKKGDEIDIVGPLGGSGFSIDSQIETPILVAGGVGAAALFALCRKLLDSTICVRPLFLIGADTRSSIILPPFKDKSVEIKIATEDGSSGFHGTVTGLLEQILPEGNLQACSIYGSGPLAMLKALAQIAQNYQVPCEVALETIMACGVGACLGCAVPTIDGPQRVCADGPVFDASDILWDQYVKPSPVKRIRPVSVGLQRDILETIPRKGLEIRTPVEKGREVNLGVDIGGIWMKNPVMPAAGTFGYGQEYAGWAVDLEALGAIVTKGIKLEPVAGNPQPRINETIAGMVNSIGLQGPGVSRFIAEKMPFLRGLGVPVIVNINGTSIAEYVELAQILTEVAGIAGLEVNISCPNVKQGLLFGQNPDLTRGLIAAIRQVTNLSLIVKLTPNVTDIVAVGQAAVDAGANALCAVNTFKALSSVNGQILLGGQSGPAIKDMALRYVYDLAQAKLGVPIVGVGGIMTWQDAWEFLRYGAQAVQIGTANFRNPKTIMEVIQGLENHCQETASKIFIPSVLH